MGDRPSQFMGEAPPLGDILRISDRALPEVVGLGMTKFLGIVWI